MEMSFKKYRAIDLIIFAVILTVCETICVLASAKWFPNELFSVSITCTIVALSMMRWGWLSVIHSILGGAVYVFVIFLCQVATITKMAYVVYCVGNTFSLFALIGFKIFSKQKIRSSWLFTVFFVVCVYLLMHFGHAIVSVCFGKPFKELINFVTFDCISLLFAIIAVLISRRLDGVFEDQKAYLFRISRAKEEKVDNYNGREYVPKQKEQNNSQNEIDS